SLGYFSDKARKTHITMADSQSIIALNIGSQRISMGVFAQTKKGLVLKSQGATSILADPATEAARIPQVQLAITELAKSLKLTKQKTAYALSGQSVFVRFVKLPPLESEDVGELVRFEAQQNVPFPIDEVVWDWEALKGGGIETEVVLVAIKSDSLNDLNEVVAETGLGTRLVDAAPTALYNALRYNYPDLTESTLLLDVGAKTSNLIYAEGEKFFTRSVPVGGSSLTSAIAKDYNVSFAEAENTKLTAGLVLLGGGHASQLDEATAALGTVIRNGLTRLTAEVARTTQLFRSQHGGSAPTKVLLAGGGANLPYMKEFLEEKLNLPVEIFNPLQRISVGKGVDVEALGAQAHMLGEIVGLGLRASDKATINIDRNVDMIDLFFHEVGFAILPFHDDPPLHFDRVEILVLGSGLEFLNFKFHLDLQPVFRLEALADTGVDVGGWKIDKIGRRHTELIVLTQLYLFLPKCQ
ncbi:type IV pilus assembly protein PilM, partial [Akkermansiaceae bacterium]|nr:type IV pilus assembly protein PilM [Akkermansiaceae bacterium]